MSTSIGIIGDPHSAPAALEQALRIFAQRNIDTILCLGDIAGYNEALAPTVELLQQHHVQCIVGNHDQHYLETASTNRTNEYRFLEQLPVTLELNIEGKRIYVVHAEPPTEQHGGIKLLNLDGDIIEERKVYWQRQLQDFDYDILLVGHTHQVFAVDLGKLMVINPGSSAFNHSCMILTLPAMNVETIALENKEIVKCWNWGMFVRGK